jgi:hypothetical protein
MVISIILLNAPCNGKTRNVRNIFVEKPFENDCFEKVDRAGDESYKNYFYEQLCL